MMLSPGGFVSSPAAPSPATSQGGPRTSVSAGASPLPTTHLGSLDYPPSLQQQQQQQQYGSSAVPVADTKDAPPMPKGEEGPARPPRPPPAIALSLALERFESASCQIAAIRSGAEALIEAVDHASRLNRNSSSSAINSQTPASISPPLPPPPPPPSSFSSTSSDQVGGVGSSARGKVASPPAPSSASQGTSTGGGFRSSPGLLAGVAPTPQDAAGAGIPAAIPVGSSDVSGLKPGMVVLSVAKAVRKAINELRVTGKELLAALVVDSGAPSASCRNAATATSRVSAGDPSAPVPPAALSSSLPHAAAPPLPPPPPCPDGSRLLFEWCRYLEGHAVATAIEHAKAASTAFAEQSGEWQRGRCRRISSASCSMGDPGSNPFRGRLGEGGNRRGLGEGNDLGVIFQRVTDTCPNMKLSLSSFSGWGRHVYPPGVACQGGGRFHDLTEARSARHVYQPEAAGVEDGAGARQQRLQSQLSHPDFQLMNDGQKDVGLISPVGMGNLGLIARGWKSSSARLGAGGVGGGEVLRKKDGGNASVIHVACPGVFQAVIALESRSRPVAISVFAPDEVVGVHAWGLSSRHVFSLLTTHVLRALHCFNEEEEEEEEEEGGGGLSRDDGGATAAESGRGRVGGLERLLKWLYSYRSLFTEPCAVCRKVLAHDPPSRALLPPILRPFGIEKRRQERQEQKRKRKEDTLRQQVQCAHRAAHAGSGLIPADLAAMNRAGKNEMTLPLISPVGALGSSSLASLAGGGGGGSDGENRVGVGAMNDRSGRFLAGIVPQQGLCGNSPSHLGGYGREEKREESLAYHINCVLKKESHGANEPAS
ncbi:hypothetical protein CBR_g10855 [Chara braunii]|uniref:Mediator of RNA polymerase II transcription subunit 27 n=1 Tax=Chara braunii TaxID=69332 RepID=A0A388KPD8_CHABU|nr:hypothetical protein CBR_g10855 [Chara braunii]|eukprot:GBG71919.1 hypothetical protein CBR_g10855 [Chara braunii]